MSHSSDMVRLDNLRDILSEKGLTQTDLKYRTGISSTTITKVAKGGTCRRFLADKIGKAIGVPAAQLITGVEVKAEQVSSPPALSLVAGQRDPVQYPVDPENFEGVMGEARYSNLTKRLDAIEESLRTIADSVSEIATRPDNAPKRCVVVTEYE